MEKKQSYSLEQVLSENHIRQILSQVIGHTNCEIICSEIKQAADGLTGFLGDHIRAVLHVKVGDEVRKIHLFVKRVPVENKPKAEFIELNNYFKKEVLMLRLIDDLKGHVDSNPWGPKAFVCTDNLIVMPDLAVAGYSIHPLLEPLDFPHVMLTAASLARYHAAFANYDTRKTLETTSPYNFYAKYKHLLVEPTFQNTQWVRTAAKLTANILDAFSSKYSKILVPDLEDKLAEFLKNAAECLNVVDENFNVMLHKDLWNNNILFKHEEGVPTNAILIDYQCVRYGPPAFDLMSFLYLTTSRHFREEHESEVLKYYYEVFSESLEDATRKRLHVIGYNKKKFLSWCEKSRMFGISEAVAMFPQVLMDAQAAEKLFNDPDSFVSMEKQDLSATVVDYARKVPLYRHRNLEVFEEFVERFVILK